MIRREYICDICDTVIRNGFRIKHGFQIGVSAAGMVLVDLSDEEASEKVICLTCAKALRCLLNRLPMESSPTVPERVTHE